MKNRSAFRRALLAVVAAAYAAPPGMAAAQTAGYPSKPIRMIIPYSAGGGTDLFMRVLTEAVAKKLGQNFVIENKPGANTIIGAQALLSAPADGYTLMVTTQQTFSTVPFTNKNPGYDPIKSFAPITMLAATEFVLVVNAAVKARTLPEFIELARARPGEISLGTYGTQLNAEEFQKRLGLKLNSVPFKGVEAVHALAAGQVDAMFDGLFTALPNVRSGRIRPLAVMQAKRSEFAPDVPALSEYGLTLPQLDIWYVLVAPKGLDAGIAERLRQEFQLGMTAPEVKEKMKLFSLRQLTGGPQAWLDQVKMELEYYAPLAREVGLQPQ